MSKEHRKKRRSNFVIESVLVFIVIVIGFLWIAGATSSWFGIHW